LVAEASTPFLCPVFASAVEAVRCGGGGRSGGGHGNGGRGRRGAAGQGLEAVAMVVR
jgi:hypothetical protein